MIRAFAGGDAAIDRKRSSGTAGRVGHIVIALAMLVELVGCGRAQLQPAGPISAAERTILLDSVVIMLAIVIPTIVATLAIAWWYRASNSRARRQPDFVYSGRVEIVVWSIPALVVIFLGGIAWISSHDLDPAQPLPSHAAPIDIQVVSLDWKWLFIYPKLGIASVNKLVVPAGVPLHLMVTSASVWNVFWVPQLGSMLYCMNGMAGTLYLQADHPGTYRGMSAMISGDGFPDMHFDADAVPRDQFTAWAASTRGSGPALNDSAYRELLRQSVPSHPYTYGSVRPGLFADIVMQRLPPGDGPRSEVADVHSVGPR
ncbi:MAG TPA: COX aromatic rich motif-containing protein [Steroidobacteraceae bacterium]|nr:COX aromatic rich motif-containing protein [Steroidobacteraceae bacterium]